MVSGETTPPNSRSVLPAASLPSSWEGQLLPSGSLLAGRYRILRFLAAGGMGVVYEALDTELDQNIALKTLHPKLLDSRQALDRFRREIQLARKVTHPNVCRIFDLGFDRLPDGTGESVFLTMELLPGETLAAHLERLGPRPEAQALSWVRQLVAGLAAAHEVGIVHRDFKAANVMMVGQDEAIRLVITDFGLARLTDEDDQSPALTEAGDLLGTPATMAPEQLTDGPITPAVDIYALGVVLYQLVTGGLPFPATRKAAARRLTEAAPSPRLVVPSLSASWEATILRCLERDPALRFSRITQVVEGLEHEIRPGLLSRQPRLLGAAAGLLLVLGTGLGLYSMPASPPARQPVVAATQRSAVAVLGFRNLSGRAEDAWLATALAEMLRTELGLSAGLRVVSADGVARMKAELSLEEAQSYSRETLDRIAKNLDVDLVVGGAYLALPGADGQLRLDLSLQDTQKRETLLSVSEQEAQSRLFELVSRLGSRLRRELALQERTASDASTARAAFPVDPEAGRLYSEGLEQLRHFQRQKAADLFQAALRLEPRHALLHSALSEAWAGLGYGAEARREAKEAVLQSPGLPEAERLFLEGRWNEVEGHWQEAAQLYGRLVARDPGNLDYGLRLATAQSAGDRPAAALETLKRLRALSGSHDPRLDLAEAKAATAISDYQLVQEAAQRAVDEGQKREMDLVVAEARLQQCPALAELGDFVKAREACLEAKALYTSVHDRGGEAWAMLELARLDRRQRGELAQPLVAFAEVLTISQELGDKRLEASVLQSMGQAFWMQGRLDEAERQQQRALTMFREMGASADQLASVLEQQSRVLEDRGRLAEAEAVLVDLLKSARERGDVGAERRALRSVGNFYRRRDDWEKARQIYQLRLQMALQVGDRYGENGEAASVFSLGRLAMESGDAVRAVPLLQKSIELWEGRPPTQTYSGALWHLAEAQRLQGRLDLSVELYARVLKLRRDSGDKDALADALRGYGEMLTSLGRTDEAAVHLEEALQIARDVGSRRAQARALLLLGSLHLQEPGTMLRGEAKLEEALIIGRELKHKVLEVQAQALYGLALSIQGDLKPALAQLEPALETASAIDNTLARSDALQGLARVRLEQGQIEVAQSLMDEVLNNLGAKTEYRRRKAEALWLKGQILLERDELQQARSTIEEGSRLARENGIELWALRAEVTLAEVGLLQGRREEARSLLNAVVERLTADHHPGLLAEAQLVLCEIHLLENHLEAAREAAREASKRAVKDTGYRLRLQVARSLIAAEAAIGRATVHEDLESILAETIESDWQKERLETELALGRLELALGQVEVGRKRLEGLAKQATSMGFLRLARQAASLAKAQSVN